jgi:hypothetical protein
MYGTSITKEKRRADPAKGGVKNTGYEEGTRYFGLSASPAYKGCTKILGRYMYLGI